MSEWSVALTIEGPGAPGPLDDAIATIHGKLEDLAPAISVSLDAVTIRVAVDGPGIHEAVARAVDEITAAVESVGWPSNVRELDATEWSRFERLLGDPTYPELVGITEIAELLGTSRQRASELARSSKFPAPLAELAAGPVWLKPTVARFAHEWDRKPGRPRTKTGDRLEQITHERHAREGRA